MRRAIGCQTRFPTPSPKVDCPEAEADGAHKRFCRNLPPVHGPTLRRFRSFVRVFIRANLAALRLEPLTDMAICSWLEKSTYTKGEKNKMWRALRNMQKHIGMLARYSPDVRSRIEKFYSSVGAYSSFGKEEHFDTGKYQVWNIVCCAMTCFKQCRGIQGASLVQKMVMGPVESCVETVMFEFVDRDMGFKPFIKHTSESERIEEIERDLGSLGGLVKNTDFTSFESSVGSELQDVVERQLFSWMTRDLGEQGRVFMMMYNFLYMRPLQAKFRTHTITLRERKARMSGCMWTSLMNGWINYLVNKFMASEYHAKFYGKFEGDDGLIVTSNAFPAGEVYSRLGMVIKMQGYRYLGDAGFLSMYWDRDTRTQMCDPIKFLGSLGWSHSKIATYGGERVCLGLLKAKCISSLDRLPKMPVVAPICFKIINKLSDVKARVDGLTGYHDQEVKLYTQEKLNGVVDKFKGVSYADRITFARLFGLSPNLQKLIENQFGETLGEQSSRTLDLIMPTVWRDYYDQYVFRQPKGLPWQQHLRYHMSRAQLRAWFIN